MYQTDRGDGLTPYQRIRGRVAMTRIVRFGEKVLYKPSKTVKMDKTEARWKYGLWLGIIEHTCKHIIGTEHDVVKCGAISPLCGQERFDAVLINAIKGTPWKPSPKHSGHKIRTNLEVTEDESDEELDDEFEVPVDWNEDVEEARRIVNESRKSIEQTPSKPQGFRITQSDIARYGMTRRFLGCKHVTGIVDYQIGHNATCRKRIMELMKEDPEDKHRVEYWELVKGIKEPEKVPVPEDDDNLTPKTSATGEKKTASACPPSSSSQSNSHADTSLQSNRAEDGTYTRHSMDVEGEDLTKVGQKHFRDQQDETTRVTRMRFTSKKRAREPEDPDEVGDTHEDGWWKSHRGGLGHGEEGAKELQPLFAQFSGYIDLEKEMIGREADVGVRNHILRELVDKDCTVAATGTSCDDAFNAIAHKIQKNRGMFFVHKTQDNAIITNA